MLITDRELYLAFAEAVNADFDWLIKVIDGEEQAGGGQASYLASVTGTKPRLWMEGGDAKTRLIAVKVWQAKRQRSN
ncbi:hypothetical protein C4J81_16540 [Deltaproteobacteria bacterium Smac51]|nr:hypothetical protein C4J81_16540 [Deltaproteobacteria bacterium Smac51]